MPSEPRLFASPSRRRLSAEQIVDSLFAVAGKPFHAEEMNMDVDGRRPVILIGLLGSAMSYAFFALAASLPTLFLARTLAGIAGANVSTAQAFIADTTTPETRAKGMGLIGAAFGLGFIFGPAIGGFLSHWGYAAPAWFAAGLSLANLPMVLLVYFLVVTSFASFEATFALYSERRFAFTPATIGYMFAWIGVVLATVQGVLVGRVVKRLGEKKLVPAAICLIALALGLVPLAWTVPLLAAVAGLLALGMGFNSPSLLSSISQLADNRDQGSTLGVSQSLGSLARIIGPMWGGWVFDQFGIGFPFYTSAGLMFVACVLSVVAFSRVELGVEV